MDNIVTQEQLLNISEIILQNASSKVNYLLDEDSCKRPDILENKKKLLALFAKFKSSNYLYDFPLESTLHASNYNLAPNSKQTSTVSQVDNAVTKYIDKQILTTDIYLSIIKVSFKLTDDEAKYLINTFLDHVSEEKIAQGIGISKTYLQKIKKSCIVKMWTDLGKYCE